MFSRNFLMLGFIMLAFLVGATRSQALKGFELQNFKHVSDGILLSVLRITCGNVLLSHFKDLPLL